MAYEYYQLPLFTLSDIVNNKNMKFRYRRLSHTISEHELEQLQPFHKGSFQLSGTNHYMPEFLVSEEAKNSLIYPQGFLIMEADSSYYTDRDNLDSYEISFTLDGEGILEYRGEKYTLKKGEGYFINCNEHHRYETSGKNWIRTIFHINGKLVETLFSKYASDGNVKFTIDTCPNFEMLQIQVLKTSLKIMPYREYRISCLLDLLLTELLTSNNKELFPETGKKVLSDIINYLDEHYNEDITLETLTHNFGINRTYLCKEFKNYTGFSIKKYILTLRINHAKLLLNNSIYSVNEISEMIGFHDTTHFIQLFKKIAGITPHQFRKNAIKKPHPSEP